MNRRNALFGLSALAGAPWWPDLIASPAPVNQRPIPSSGEMLPMVGLGTWLTFDVSANNSMAMNERKKILSSLLKNGAKVVDSSPMYGRSESIIGDASRSLGISSDLFMSTKVWTTGRESGVRQIKSSAQKMNKRQLDLVEIHNLQDWKTHMATLLRMKDDGEIRYLGITHYLSHAYDRMEHILKNYPIDFIQINYNISHQGAADRLLPAALNHGKAVIINRPFAGGNVFRRIRDKPLPGVAQELDCQNWAQLLLKFVLSNPAVTCAIPGTSQNVHVIENVLASAGPLPDEKQKIAIEKAYNG